MAAAVSLAVEMWWVIRDGIPAGAAVTSPGCELIQHSGSSRDVKPETTVQSELSEEKSPDEGEAAAEVANSCLF